MPARHCIGFAVAAGELFLRKLLRSRYLPTALETLRRCRVWFSECREFSDHETNAN